MGTWFRLLADNHFRVHPTRLALATTVTLAGPFNEAMRLAQKAIYGRRLDAQQLPAPPLFILGHWRSGTTLMHELIAKDDRLGGPSTYQCFAPHHFLVSEWFFRSFGKWLLPSKRPMDNMEAGWDRPQEDEFALMNLGVPSPYRRIAFPNETPPDLEYLDLADVPQEKRDEWLAALHKFLLSVTLRKDQRLVLKSPTHTGRLRYLAEFYPGTKFIHMTRDPRSLFPSTCRLWPSLDHVQALQKPSSEVTPELEAYVIECLQRMYTAFERDIAHIDPEQIIHVRYEDLVADPVNKLAEIYETLKLDGFDDVRPTLQEWADSQHREYKVNKHSLPPETEARIRTEWADYFERYGYA